MPPLKDFTDWSAASARPNCSSSSSARRRAAARSRWNSRPNITRFCRAVRISSTAAFWPVRPIRRRTRRGCLRTSIPPTQARPPSIRSSVARIRTAVVLPAPLGPSSP